MGLSDTLKIDERSTFITSLLKIHCELYSCDLGGVCGGGVAAIVKGGLGSLRGRLLGKALEKGLLARRKSENWKVKTYLIFCLQCFYYKAQFPNILLQELLCSQNLSQLGGQEVPQLRHQLLRLVSGRPARRFPMRPMNPWNFACNCCQERRGREDAGI